MAAMTPRKAFRWVFAATLLLVLGAGCTKYANEQDLQTLETQKQAVVSAENKRDDMLRELESLQAEKKKAQAELIIVQTEKNRIGRLIERGEVTPREAGDDR